MQLDRQTRLLDPLIRVAQPIMQGVAGDLRLPGVLLLCRSFRKQVMCIHQEFVERPASAVSYERGRPMPPYRGAASKVILANLPARPVRAFYDASQADMAAAARAGPPRPGTPRLPLRAIGSEASARAVVNLTE